MSLKEQLLSFAAETNQAIPGYESLVEDATSELEAEFADRRMLKPGDLAPSFSLPSATGEQISLEDRLETGPVILNFYRGGWCPYCNLELRAYQAIVDEIRASGASLIAVSPQSPDDSLSTAEKESLSFDVLSDFGSETAEQYRIAFDLGGRLKEFQEKAGYDLPQFTAAKNWRIPVPATFVIGSDGLIKLAHVDLDYRKRLEPQEALDALNRL